MRCALPGLLSLIVLNIPANSAANPDWFPKQQMTTIGVYYYPEAWPESQWARDIGNIRKLGMEYIHMGEFAWYFMEPEEGKYQFDWLEKSVELAASQGLKVVLCTPSATPPIWLTHEHPETLMVDQQGRTMIHGSREHGDWSSPLYREYVSKIDTELAKRFGHNPHVWGWQIDNELSHYGRRFSYSAAATVAFRNWLRERYDGSSHSEYGLGRRILVGHVRELRSDRNSKPGPVGGGPEPACRVGFRALLCGFDGGLHPDAGRCFAAIYAKPMDHYEFHGHA